MKIKERKWKIELLDENSNKIISGIYFICGRFHIYYIGQSKDIIKRINTHNKSYFLNKLKKQIYYFPIDNYKMRINIEKIDKSK